MKKFYFVLALLLFAMSVHSQQQSSATVIYPDGIAIVKPETILQKQQMKPTKELPIGWMIPAWDLLDYFWTTNSMCGHFANVIFPDSIVVYESGGTIRHNWLCSVGGVFDPYSIIYDSLQINPLIPQTQPYRIDSVFILAWYNVVDATIPDTLVIELVNGNATAAPEFAWSVFSYPTDTFDVSPPKVYGSTFEKGFLCNMTASSKTVIKYPLTLNDSTNLYGKYITIPVNYNVPAGKVTGLSMTYVSGKQYSYGDMLHSYSGTQTPVLNSFRAGLYSTTDAVSNPHIFADPYYRWNSHHYINTMIRYAQYTGGNTWRNERMASTMNWGFDIGYFITNTTPGIGLQENSLNDIKIYPTPANNFIILDNATIGTLVNITDISGRILCSKTLTATREVIQTDMLSTGVYLITLSNQNNVVTSKLIITKP